MYGYIILAGLVGLILAGVLFQREGFQTNIWPEACGVFGFIGVFIFFLVLLVCQSVTRSEIAAFKAVKGQVEGMAPMQAIGAVIDVNERNAWLESHRWGNRYFDIFVPDEVERLEPIRLPAWGAN